MYLVKLYKTRRGGGNPILLTTGLSNDETNMVEDRKDLQRHAVSFAADDWNHDFYVAVYPINHIPVYLQTVYKYHDTVSIDTIIE